MTEPLPVLLMANYASRVGGGEDSLLTLAGGLVHDRFALQAVVPGEGEVAADLRRLGVLVTVLPLPPVRPWRPGAILHTLRELQALLRFRRIRLVHANGSRSGLYAGLAARRLGVPVVWHARIATRDPTLDPMLLALSTRVIAISKAVAARFRASRHAAKVRVVYNGVDPAAWNPEMLPRPSDGALKILTVGRLSHEKGQATLVRAAPIVLHRIPAARFVLAGADFKGYAARIRALARRIGVNAAFDWRGWVADPRPVFQEADVVAVPSRSEGFGRVLVEAGLLRKPVVASRVGGIPEVVVDEETGLLVPAGDPAALGAALLRLLENADLRAGMGHRARERALQCFTARQHVQGVQAVYEELLLELTDAPRSAR